MPTHDPWDHNPKAAFLPRDHPRDPGPGPSTPEATPETHSPKSQSSEGDVPEGPTPEAKTEPKFPAAGGGDAEIHPRAGGPHPGAEAPFPALDHDHDHCISGALLKAEEICAERGARLTRIRRSVLEFVWESHSPVGAYDILERMNAPGPLPGGGPRSAPITVYRALEFLMAQGLVHRLASLNAYTGCGVPDTPHGAHFLICEDCGAAAELSDPGIDRAITQGAARAGFSVKAPVVEVQGRCPACSPSRAGVIK